MALKGEGDVCYSIYWQHLNTAWVEHDANGGAHSLRRKILLELGPNDTRVAVRASHATPDGANLGVVADLLGAVQENKTLACTSDGGEIPQQRSGGK